MQKAIAPNFMELWNARGAMDAVILIDNDTSEYQSNAPIWLLRDILLQVQIIQNMKSECINFFQYF